MKLPKMRRLMGLLARDMQPKQVKEMLAALPASCMSQTEREDCKSAISFFMLLKKRTGTYQAFLNKLEGVLTECNCADFLSRIEEYKVQNPDLFQEPSSQLSLPDGTRSGFKPKKGQSEKFRSILLRISRSITKNQLEIMVGLSPTPEAAKQNITEGHELFEQMERHGCISENDTEMLQEVLELLRLQDALKFLYEYHRAFPPIIHDSPQPSAPQYASFPSESLQAQCGSLPEFPSQPQSFHISQPQSLPSPSPGSSASSYGGAHPSSISRYSQQPSYSSSLPSLSSNAQTSLGQGQQQSLSSTLSSGSSSFAPLSHSSSSMSESHSAPAQSLGGGGGALSMPFMESGEQSSSLANKRQFVPSVSPSLQHRSLAAAMRPFPHNGGVGGSAASSPPSHTPSLTGSNDDTYPRPLVRKRPHQGGATPNGSLYYGESHGVPISPPSSGTYPRPSQERVRSYQFPTNEVLNSRQQMHVFSQSLPKEKNDDTTALSPPPSKIRRSSPDQHIGDGGCLSIQSPRTRQSSDQGQEQPASSSASSQGPETISLSTLSSYASTSEKFGPAETQGYNPNLGGGAAAAISLNSLESYTHNFSFPAAGDRPPSINVSGRQRPTDDLSAATTQRPPPLNPHYQPTLSAASSTPSYSSSINIPEGEQSSSANFQPSLPHLECAPGGLPSHASSLSSYNGGDLPLPAPVEVHSQSENRSNNSLGGGGDQLRNAQPGGLEQCAHHPDEFVHQHVHQPFHNQFAGQSASVAGSPMPSLSNSSYPGHPPSEFPSGISEAGVTIGETQPPGSSRKKQSSSRAYNSPPVPADKRKSVLSKSEASSAQGANGAQFESINVAVGRPSQLTKYQQQLLEYKKRHPDPYSQITEHGRNIAQASSESNVELRRTGSLQSALATAKEGEQALQQPASSENLLYQTARSNQLYPDLPPDTSTKTSTVSSSGVALAGSKRTRSQSQELESSEEKKEEEQTGAKRQKKQPSTTNRIFSWIKGKIYGNSSETDSSNDQSQEGEEECKNAESESEYHSANED